MDAGAPSLRGGKVPSGSAGDRCRDSRRSRRILSGSMRDRGLAPVAQYGIGPYRADFAFRAERLVVECDGRPWHDPITIADATPPYAARGGSRFTSPDPRSPSHAASCAARVEHEIKDPQSETWTPHPPGGHSGASVLVGSPGRMDPRAFPGGAPPARRIVEHGLPPVRLPADVRPWRSHLDPEQHAAGRSPRRHRPGDRPGGQRQDDGARGPGPASWYARRRPERIL